VKPRILAPIIGKGIWDSVTDDYIDMPLSEAMKIAPGGILCGYGLFKLLSQVEESVRGLSEEWSFFIHPRKHKVRIGVKDSEREVKVRLQEYIMSGPMYVTRESCRLPLRIDPTRWEVDGSKGGVKRKRHRPPTIKWINWNLEQFMLDCDPVEAAQRLLQMCENRGISPKPTPGGLGSSMLKASSEWSKERQPAPFFISDTARRFLPGNYYEHRRSFLRAKNVTLFDQAAAHHNIVNSVPLPHPQSIHRRGYRLEYDPSHWVNESLLKYHMGLLRVRVECDTVPQEMLHLYPKWSRTPGTHWRMVWTPELRLLDRRIRLLEVSTGFTGNKLDTALWEYSDFALAEIASSPHPIIKAALHAAYGSLATNTKDDYEIVIAGRDRKLPKAKPVKLPLFGQAQSVIIKRLRVPLVQNVIAYGVIQAEQTTRSIEFGRWLVSEGHDVLQVYSDAVLAKVSQIPFIPNGWVAKHMLDELGAGAPNQIISPSIQRLPGIHGQRQRALILKRVLS
jgi:hypothetical protein